jgi:hypothetical protein
MIRRTHRKPLQRGRPNLVLHPRMERRIIFHLLRDCHQARAAATVASLLLRRLGYVLGYQ